MTRPISRTLAAMFIIAASVLFAAAQKPADATRRQMSDTERAVRAFYDGYADDLRRERRESIVGRYDPRGAYILGNGSKRFESLEQIRDVYMNKWSGPKSFAWHDLSVDVISGSAAAVAARFEWVTQAGQTLHFSYTGVLVKRGGKWYIRIEDESSAPPGAGGN